MNEALEQYLKENYDISPVVSVDLRTNVDYNSDIGFMRIIKSGIKLFQENSLDVSVINIDRNGVIVLNEDYDIWFSDDKSSDIDDYVLWTRLKSNEALHYVANKLFFTDNVNIESLYLKRHDWLLEGSNSDIFLEYNGTERKEAIELMKILISK